MGDTTSIKGRRPTSEIAGNLRCATYELGKGGQAGTERGEAFGETSARKVEWETAIARACRRVCQVLRLKAE